MAQFNKTSQAFLNQGKTLYEVNMLANKDGDPIDQANPLHVSLGTENITITGDVNVGTTVSVNSTAEDPVHSHITEVGTSGLLSVPYLPVSVSNFPATQPVSGTFWQATQPVSGPLTDAQLRNTAVPVSGSVNIGTMPEVEIKNDLNNPIPVTGTFVTTSPTGTTDAFGRQRVSAPLTLFDSSHRYRDNNLWSTATTGTASATFIANEGLINLTVNNASGTQIIRETTKVFAYQPGKSLLVMNTVVPATPKANLRQRVGYFGVDNGMYFEINGTTPYFVERSLSTGTQTEVAQANWNGDKLNGTGPSGITLDTSKAQILWMDIEWLGLGTVRMGFVINGQFILCHSFHHANLITSTYITTASLPLRYELTNTGATSGSSTMKQVCSTAISEGGYELRGIQQAIGIPITTPRTLTTAGTFYPIISLRLKTSPNYLDAIVILTALSVMPIATGAYNWQIRASGTVNGGSWVSAGVDSGVEYNITGTSVTDGRILGSGFFSASNQGTTQIDILKEALFKFQLERNGLTSTPFEITLVVASNGNGDTVVASMDWEEISR
jgi:hypothetical protein